jgi:hypothetical protein
MKLQLVFVVNAGLVVSSTTQNSIKKIQELGTTASNQKLATIVTSAPLSGVQAQVPVFRPDGPKSPLKLEPLSPMKVEIPKVFDGTEYGESKEYEGMRSKHFLRKSDPPVVLEKDRKSVQSSLDVDESNDELNQALQETVEGLKESIDYVVSAIETLPNHPMVLEAQDHVDNWAQETKAGFMGYWERIQSVWKKESRSVGIKLFEAADGYSHRFFNLLHVKESDHPVLAAKVTRIIVAMGLSLTLVFVIFGLALQLQKSIIAKAHEDARQRTPGDVDDREQLFFAMPYPQSNIVVVESDR